MLQYRFDLSDLVVASRKFRYLPVDRPKTNDARVSEIRHAGVVVAARINRFANPRAAAERKHGAAGFSASPEPAAARR